MKQEKSQRLGTGWASWIEEVRVRYGSEMYDWAGFLWDLAPRHEIISHVKFLEDSAGALEVE